MRLFFAFLFSFHLMANEQCQIRTSKALLIIDNNSSSPNQSIQDTDCEESLIKEFHAIVSNASGVLTQEKLNLYLKKSKIKLSPSKIEIRQFSELLEKNVIKNENMVVKNIKQLSNNKIIQLDSLDSVDIICNNCNESGAKNVQIVYDSNLKKQRKLWITFDLLRRRFALVARKTINTFSSKLSKEDFKKVEVPLNENINLFDDFENLRFYKTNKSIHAGQVLTQGDLSPIDLVRSGRKVKVLISQKSVTLKTIGVSKSSGKLGDLVEVFNPKSKKKFVAEIIDENTVQIKL